MKIEIKNGKERNRSEEINGYRWGERTREPFRRNAQYVTRIIRHASTCSSRTAVHRTQTDTNGHTSVGRAHPRAVQTQHARRDTNYAPRIHLLFKNNGASDTKKHKKTHSPPIRPNPTKIAKVLASHHSNTPPLHNFPFP